MGTLKPCESTMADEDSDPLHPISINKPNDPPTTAVDNEPANDPFGVQAADAAMRLGNAARSIPTDPNEQGQQDADDDGNPNGPGA